MSNERNRHDLGTATFAAITRDAGGAVIESLKDIAPDLSEWIISFAYGDVMSGPGLDLRFIIPATRQFPAINGIHDQYCF